MNGNDKIWMTKVAAWVHDPAEKALVLLRDPAGHEGGTVAKLQENLFDDGLPQEIRNHVTRADQWAAAADRPQFPMEKDGGRFQTWAQVRFAERPELIHPLSGEHFEIQGGLTQIEPEHLKALSLDHFEQLIVRTQSGTDWRATALSFWRFSPDRPAKELNLLWALLPADTRIPDHTIWAHLDLVSAFAGAFAADPSGTPALLTISFGPVQDFIAQARSTSDLWAGSHLLSRIGWEGLKVICETLGPDAVLFPQLRGIPLVDLWLQEEVGLAREYFENCEWRKQKTDANPLFTAALPNRFTALVPAGKTREIAGIVRQRVRQWVRDEALETIEKLINTADLPPEEAIVCRKQAREQLEGFPEVYWAAVPWSLVSEKEKAALDITELFRAMAPFFPEGQSEPGFFGTDTWKVLCGGFDLGEAKFYRPNPGVLYPALYNLLDRVAAAAKSLRPLRQLPQEGYRCSLCGEREWLTTERKQLGLPPGKRIESDTLWTRVAAEKPPWARKGEHLCALCGMKRLWPSRFVEKIRKTVDIDCTRYVVSTHTMALAVSLNRWLDDPKPLPIWLRSQLEGYPEQAALPKNLAGRLHGTGKEEANNLLRRLPALLDALREDAQSDQQDQQVRQIEIKLKEEVFGHKPEAYYALIMMDGDRMGAWLEGGDEKYRLPFKDAWHSQVKAKAIELSRNNQQLRQYLETLRPPSPARHMAISTSLNGFALELARHVVEDLYKGKLLYSGGDDVLAMVSVDDLLPAMLLLRLLYSGIFPDGGDALRCWQDVLGQQQNGLNIARGHVLFKKRLYRMMGDKATASAGAVVAHHTAPLAMVLRVLRQSEKRAKNRGRRDAFAVTVLKRAGGAVELTCPWFIPRETKNLWTSPMGVLVRTRNALADPDLSRRVAYLIQQWAAMLPSEGKLDSTEQYESLLASNFSYQFRRQSKNGKAKVEAGLLGKELAGLALKTSGRTGRDNPADFIIDLLGVAEFLAREGRMTTNEEKKEQLKGAQQ